MHFSRTTTPGKEDPENNLWDSLQQDTFDRQFPAQPEQPHKQPFFKNIWFWTTCAAVIVLIVILLINIPASKPDTPVTSTASIPVELKPCKEALDKWQEKDACKILLTYTQSGDVSAILESAEYAEFWKSGENWIQITDMGNYVRGQMYRNGVQYQCIGHQEELFWETPLPGLESPQHNIWPLSFTWDDCELIHKDTRTTPYGKHIIFSVIETNPEHPDYNVSPYYVCFSFNADGHDSISVTKIGSDYVSNMKTTTITYQLVSEDADVISQYINEQTVLIPEGG